MHADIASLNFAQRKASILRRHEITTRLVWLVGVILAIVLVVVSITIYSDVPDRATQMVTVFVVVSAVFIILFVAVALSCLQSAKKRSLAGLAQSRENVNQAQIRRQQIVGDTTKSSSALDSPPPYDSLFNIHGVGISANTSVANFDSFTVEPSVDSCPSSSQDNCIQDCGSGGDSGGCSNSAG